MRQSINCSSRVRLRSEGGRRRSWGGGGLGAGGGQQVETHVYSADGAEQIWTQMWCDSISEQVVFISAAEIEVVTLQELQKRAQHTCTYPPHPHPYWSALMEAPWLGLSAQDAFFFVLWLCLEDPETQKLKKKEGNFYLKLLNSNDLSRWFQIVGCWKVKPASSRRSTPLLISHHQWWW